MENSTEILSLLLTEKCADQVHEEINEKFIDQKKDHLPCFVSRDGNSCVVGEE